MATSGMCFGTRISWDSRRSSVRKHRVLFLLTFYLENPDRFCQDRLGTSSVGKTQCEALFFAGHDVLCRQSIADLITTKGATPTAHFGKETPLFAMPFMYKMHDFTETGSGQT
jgi:hypothetical protein